MFIRFASFAVSCSLLLAAAEARNIDAVPERRDCTGWSGILSAPWFIPGFGDCKCPLDNDGGKGVVINRYKGYQCGYPQGPCTWDAKTGQLENAQQANCPWQAPPWAPADGPCICPRDNTGEHGILLNSFDGYQCAFPNGACTWSDDGKLQNTLQTNCPAFAPCNAVGYSA